MKKQIILPLSLLLSFVTIRASEVEPVTEPVMESVEQVAPVADAPAMPVAAIPATSVADTPATLVATLAPVSVEPAPTPAPAAAPAPVSAIPTEADIANLLGLLAAYQHQAGVLKSLHELASDDTTLPNLPNEDSIRSLLNLLELHKKESDLIVALRASITSLQTVLGKWDADVSALLTKKPSAKQKVAKRSLDFGTIKEINKPRGQ